MSAAPSMMTAKFSIAIPAWSPIAVTSFNYVVLLTGQVRDQQQRDRASEQARKTANIKRIHNELQIAAPTSMQDRRQDTWLTTKVKSALAQHASLNALNVKVVTENSTVYLMGLVSQTAFHTFSTDGKL